MTTAKVAGCLRYDDTELDEESLRKVRDELNETDESRRKCLEKLRKMLLDKDDLNPCLDEEFLLSYLRVSKFDCNKAYQRIIGYYSDRYNFPEIFNEYSACSVKIVETARQVFLSPYRMPDNSAILIVKRKDYDPSKVSYDLIIRALCMACDVVNQSYLNQMCGITILLDLKSSSWSGWNEYTPARLKMLARLIQKSIALRIRGIHVINAPSIYYLLYTIVYPFLSTKMKNRIMLHKNNASLCSDINPATLSKEYGGCLEHFELINMFEKLYETEDLFKKLAKYGFIKKMK